MTLNSSIFSMMIWKSYNSDRNLAMSPISSQQNRELYAVFCSSKKYCFKMETGAGGTCQDSSWVASEERKLSNTSQCSDLIPHLYFSCWLTGKKLKITKDAILHAMDGFNGVCAHELSLWWWRESLWVFYLTAPLEQGEEHHRNLVSGKRRTEFTRVSQN